MVRRHSMKIGILMIACFALMLLPGCMGLFHPQAEAIYQQAQGSNSQHTALTILEMMKTSAQQAKNEHGASPGIEALHDQFHAFYRTFCDFSDQQRATTAYEQAVTLTQELKTVFHRLWKFKQDTTLRGAHLDLLLSRIRELHTFIQEIPT